ncbi:MAG: SRPBCC family protein [Chitinophagales bacterium]
MPKGLYIEKSVEIARSKSEVYNYLKYCRNQDQFSVWNMADPEKKTNYTGTDGEVGFVYSWDSTNKNVGAGSQEIKKMNPDERIEYELRFERPMKNVGVSVFTLAEAGSGTKVTWNFSGPTKFPMSLFKGMFQKMLGKDIAKSLDNLKTVLEK